MTTAIAEEPLQAHLDDHGSVPERVQRLEGEVAELRHTLSDLAEIVVGDIRERREATTTVSEVPIPASIVPGGQATLTAVNALRRPWLLIDLLREIGAGFRMYADPRYRTTRSTKVLVPVILALFVLNYLAFNYTLLDIPVIRQLVQGLIEVILAVLLYKVVSREVARYRQAMALLSVGARTWNALPAALIHNDPDGAAHQRQESP
jgi:hypothetical protein